ncbi:tetratricopeptide repeat protein [Streptomyces sp. NEAU-sy36]|uniref:AfsR/SARP family transcriptional regulator n=1 Tax=Streptomyces sp. NEAU-H33 TaxID=2979463 RepID=UPI0015D5CB68|nr:tetratricopeptide repeat protein [Streptomyces sp. NEAU-H33]QLJ04450.1 tetratricopeptide repeat protein [Streptomyces sp. NEAU-sy36]
MEGYVLGPVRAEGGGGRRVVEGSKVAALFALLVTSPGCRCTRKEIAEVLWEGDEEVGVRVDRVVADLRKRLGQESVPHSGKSGYCTLRVPVKDVDLLRFREKVKQAEGLTCKAQFELLGAALDEWNGEDEPLHGLSETGFHLRREELRAELMAAVYARLDAAYKSREVKWLREETEKWFERAPELPKIFRYYLLAHADLPEPRRERLITNWEERNGKADVDVQSAIDQVRGEGRRPGGALLPPVPDQLPGGRRKPIGQDELIGDLFEAVCEEQDAGNLALVLISGMAGVGKTTVAENLAGRLRERFPDGVLRGELNGFADGDVRPAEPDEILDGFLAALPPYATVTGTESKSNALRSALAHRSVLIVLDDALSAQQVLPLLPGDGTCAVIVTSRNDLLRLQSERKVLFRKMEPLHEADALEVLQEKVSAEDRAKHAMAFSELVDLCGRLPLALVVVARLLEGGARPLHTLPLLVQEMKEERKLAMLDTLDLPEHELSVRAALNCSVRVLNEEARLLLWQLAVHPGPSASWEAVMDLGRAVDEGTRTDRALVDLVAANLVEHHGDRYGLHDLVRAFALRHVRPVSDGENAEIERATVRQVLEHQLHNVQACDRVLDRERTLPTGEPGAVRVTDPADLAEAMAFLDEEYPAVQRGIRLAINRRMDRYVWLLPMALVIYQWRRRLLDHARQNLRYAAEAAETVASPVDRAMVYRSLAGTHWRLGEYDLAVGNLRRAVRLSEVDRSTEGRLSLARTLHRLGLTLRKQGDRTGAEEALGRALELCREVSDRVGEAAVLNVLGAIDLDRGEHEQALRRCADALGVVERTTVRSGLADVLFTLAKVHLARSERDEAITLYRQASDIYREQENWPNEDKVRMLFADVLVSAGDTDAAVRELERVIVLRELMGGEGVREVRERLEGLR